MDRKTGGLQNKFSEYYQIVINNPKKYLMIWLIGFIIGNFIFGISNAPFFSFNNFGMLMGVIIGFIFVAVVLIINMRQESKIKLRLYSFYLLFAGGVFNLILGLIYLNGGENTNTIVFLLTALLSIITAIQIKRSDARQAMLSSITVVTNLLIIFGIISWEAVVGGLSLIKFSLIILPSIFSIVGGYMEYNYINTKKSESNNPKRTMINSNTLNPAARNWVLTKIPLVFILIAELYFSLHLCGLSANFTLLLPLVCILTIISLISYRPSVAYLILAIEAYLALTMTLTGNGQVNTSACGVGFNGIGLTLIILFYAIFLYVFVIKKQINYEIKSKESRDKRRQERNPLLLFSSILLFIIMFFADIIILGACSQIGVAGLPIIFIGLIILFVMVSKYFNNLLSGIAVIFMLFVLWLPNSVGFCGNPLGTACIAQTGYICQSPILHLSNFTATVGQATGTNWNNTYILWVPSGQNLPSITSHFCPPSASNSISGGISCYNAGNLSSGSTAAVKFVFDTVVNTGSTHSGTIYASYYVGSQGPYNVQVATVSLKAV